GLTVSAPRWTPLYEVEAVLQEKAAWIVRKLNEMHARRLRAQASRLEWREGTVLPWLGQPLVLRLRQALDQAALLGATSQRAELSASASGLHRGRARRVAKPVLDTEGVTPSGEAARVLRLDLPADAPPAQIRDAVHAWFLEEARALFAQRLDHYAPMLQVQWRKLALSNARTRW
ncbi:DUF45 domain-containing protein, partial [Leptospira sp. 96542]|nr:DUF45 domain-containing protein [Leptospira sp. 96542]